MQTTLRIADTIYREAKAEAARQGTTLTRFIEDALKQRLCIKETKSPLQTRFRLPVVKGGNLASGIQNLDHALKIMEDDYACKATGRNKK